MDQNSEGNVNNQRGRDFSGRRRSIRDISLSDELKGRRRPARSTRTSGEKKSYYKRGSGAARHTVTFLLIALIVFGGFFAVSVFARATLVVEPRSERVSVSEEVTISAASVGDTVLNYEIFSLEEAGSKVVQGGEERQVERSAQGRITIYNTESSDQALVIRTRFESEDGNIYRVLEPIVVPAASGGNPGTITVSVTADEVGPESNLSSGRLTIPGLEGTDLYTKMYAEVSSPIEGGFVGRERAISDEDENEAREEMESELISTLEEKALSSLPSEYILIPESTFFEFTDLPNESSGENVSVRTKGEILGVMVKRDLLASYLATEHLSDYQNSPLDMAGEGLNLKLVGEQITLDSIQSQVTLALEGDVDLRWRLDEDYLREIVSGVDKNEAVNIAASVPGVRSVRLELVPGFLRSIPTNVDKIDVIMVDEL